MTNGIENTPCTIYTSLIMQNIPFSPNTETIIRMLSANDSIIECLPSVPRCERTQRFIGNIYDDIKVHVQLFIMLSRRMMVQDIRLIRDIFAM